MAAPFTFTHHGAVRGVTGSCHQLHLADGRSLLVDIGLFQGVETSPDGASAQQLEVSFPLQGVVALVARVLAQLQRQIVPLRDAGCFRPVADPRRSPHAEPCCRRPRPSRPS